MVRIMVRVIWIVWAAKTIIEPGIVINSKLVWAMDTGRTTAQWGIQHLLIIICEKMAGASTNDQ